jgi:subtilisin family serine protease
MRHMIAAMACVPVWSAEAGPRHWVYFADKGHATSAAERAAVESLASAASRSQIERRERRRTLPGLFDARDLPVSAGYVRELEGMGLRVHQRSRWLNAVSVEATPEQLRSAAGLGFVERIEPVRGGRRVGVVGEANDAVSGAAVRDDYGWSSEQLHQISLPAVHARGATGQGVVVAVLDTGFVTTHRAFTDPVVPLRVRASWDFVNNDAVVGIEPGDHPDQHRHGTWILGTLAAYWPGTLVGGAYGAEYILCKTEDYASETPVEEDNYVAGLEWAESLGADVATSSLGYIDWYTQADLDGATAVTTIAVNMATQNGMFCVTAAGNEGNDGNPATSRLIAPADAMEVITCGAVDAGGTITWFSSDGPTADGRVKPELLARGLATRTVSSSSNDGIAELSGTSLSTPLVAAAVACLVQERPCRTVPELRGALFASASRNGVADPLGVHGFGILNAAASGSPACPADFNGDGFSDFFDFDAFVICFEGEGCAACSTADIDGDGFVDFFDFVAFVAVFEQGC